MGQGTPHGGEPPSRLDGSDGPVRLYAVGETGRIILDRDWSGTSLGPIDGWSPALKGNISMLLAAQMQIILFWGPDYLAFYNDAYAPAIGDKHPRALGQPMRETSPELLETLGPLLDRVRLGGESMGAKDRQFRIRRNGTDEDVFFDLSYSPVFDSDGGIGGVLCLVSETTERVRAQRRAVAARERLGRMFEQAPSFMALLDEPGHVFEFTNIAFQQLIGGRDVIGRMVADALPETVEQGLGAILDEVVRTGEPYNGRNLPVALQRTPNEPVETRLLTFVYQPILDEDGHVTSVFVEGTDTTERVRAEERLLVSEGSLRLATEVAGLGTWDHDLIGGTLEWDRNTKAAFGLSPDAPCTMQDFYAGLHPEDASATSAAFAAALDPAIRSIYDVEYRTIGKEDGVLRWVAARGRGIFDASGRCVRAIGTATDITARRRTQEQLRESEHRFRTVADSAPALIWMCDAHGALVFANRWHEETFGRPVNELLGGGWQAILHPDDVDGYVADFDRAFAERRPFERDVRVVDRHGRTRWLHSEARARFVEGRFAGYVGCDIDVTQARTAAEELERLVAERTAELAASNRQLSAQIEERERVEATLAQMQRLEAVGQLTSGVAHDFNNLLTVILGNLDLVARAAGKSDLDERTRRRLDTMRAAAERGATLTAQLLAFSRRQRLEARAIDLNDAVAGMRELLQSSMGGSVRLEVRTAEDLWPALVDPTQIELIILNLAINARDAMQVGGTLLVETANLTLGAPGRPEEPAPGDYVMVAVSDSGTGMTADVAAKAFEPFFTTKPVGKGSGLGLAQVYGFAKQSGGGVGLETGIGHGTTVRVYLPRARIEVTTPAMVRDLPHAAAEASGRRVLLVDDDPPVREITSAAIQAIGAVVTEAGSGADALAELAQANGAFDLMVADFAMPGMNGAELAEAATRRWPHLPVLFVTGFADLTAIAAVSADRIVQKPFRASHLQRKIMRMLPPVVS